MHRPPQLAPPEVYVRCLAIFQRTFSAIEGYSSAGDKQGIILGGHLANYFHNITEGLWRYGDDEWTSPRRMRAAMRGLPTIMRGEGAPDRLIVDCKRIVSKGGEAQDLGLQNGLEDFNLPPVRDLSKYLNMLQLSFSLMRFIRRHGGDSPTRWDDLEATWTERADRFAASNGMLASALSPLPSGLVQWSQFDETQFLERARSFADNLPAEEQDAWRNFFQAV